MKKISTLIILLVLVFVLSACGNPVKENNLLGDHANQQNQSNASLVADSDPSAPSNQNQPQNDQATEITRERALEISLEKAGVKRADIHDLSIELDNERGVLVWEVDFDYGNLEYSYDVNAKTGDITKVEREIDH